MITFEMLTNGQIGKIRLATNTSFHLRNRMCVREAEQGTPVEAFYLETSAWTFRHILMGRNFGHF